VCLARGDLDALLALGLRYDKRQKKQLLAAGARPVLPTEADVRAFEADIGYALPPDYRAFLLVTNGGAPDPHVVAIPGRGDAVVRHCFALLSPARDLTLGHQRDVYAARIPAWMLPIADDPAGNRFLIDLQSGAGHGHVHFWDHEEEADGEVLPWLANIHRVADGFGDFLSRLR